MKLKDLAFTFNNVLNDSHFFAAIDSFLPATSCRQEENTTYNCSMDEAARNHCQQVQTQARGMSDGCIGREHDC
eukprot:2125142-Pleurochrysis_carterae.AAC.2